MAQKELCTDLLGIQGGEVERNGVRIGTEEGIVSVKPSWPDVAGIEGLDKMKVLKRRSYGFTTTSTSSLKYSTFPVQYVFYCGGSLTTVGPYFCESHAKPPGLLRRLCVII
ncbi:MAG: hypothetical protein GXY61_08280 [Lentisphaerae bacterium]|nr:hypothetical protein [Lentisphaerota bacterium]